MNNRERIKNKFGGLCAYSGTPLQDDWQVDHVWPKAMGGTDDESNLLPVQKILNHYKRSLPIDLFKSWYLAGLHKRLAKLPKNPRTPASLKRKEYLHKVANLMGIDTDNPFCGQLFYEK